MGVLAEVFSDDKGLSWPAAVAPYSLHIVSLHKSESDNAYAYAKDLYEELTREGVEVIWDDRHVGAGEKLNDADLLGMPMRVLVSEKSILAGGVEIKERKSEQSEVITREQLMTMYSKVC
jgi:prolyl-tRNA synthetase